MGEQVLGRFIVWEGGEGAGKTTQIAMIQAWLGATGWADAFAAVVPDLKPAIIVTREPGGTTLGQHLRQALLHSCSEIDPTSELLLYAADRAQHLAEKIRPHLQAGGLVLCDRFTASTVAYQGYGRGLDLELIHHLNEIATAGCQPDLTLWLDVDPGLGLERTTQRARVPDRMEQATLAFHHRVHQGFCQLCHQAPTQMIRINANLSPAAVTSQIQTCLQAKLCQWYPQISVPLLVNTRPENS